MRHEPLSQRALHRWPGILAALGVPSLALRNRHGPCPIPGCGGRDRFRFDDKGGRGTWICSRCGAGDGIELVKRIHGFEFKEAAIVIEQQIGAAPIVRNVQRSDAKTREQIVALWKRSKSITVDDPAGKYLHARLGLNEFSDVLRYAADERYCDYGSRPTWHPMMVAKVDPSDTAAADGERPVVHRTYLDKFGGKADVLSPRKVLGSMPTGAAIRLAPATDKLGIAEGIETALAASILFNMPVWAALNAAIMQSWAPPAAVTTVFVFGDNDASATGQAAAYALTQKLKAKGIAAFVEIPLRTGEDWADVLIRQRARG